MTIIARYPLVQGGEVVYLPMPIGSRILSVQVQKGTACLFALVDTTQPIVTRALRWAAVGEVVTTSDANDYIGTFQLYGGTEVFHLFDLGEI